MQSEIFRKKALERLSSPEQLDQLIRVTSPPGWFALGAIGLLLATALVWGIFGRIPTTVRGSGILIRVGGTYEIQSPGEGQVRDLDVAVGDRVREGQIIGRLVQPQVEDQIRSQKRFLQELRAVRGYRADFQNRTVDLNRRAAEEQRDQIEAATQTLSNRIQFLTGRVTARREAHALGLTTPDDLQNAVADLTQAENQLKTFRTQLRELDIKILGTLNTRDQELRAQDREIIQNELKILEMERQYELATRIVSPYTGRVAEVKYNEGTIIRQGLALVSIEPEDVPLEALFFIPQEGSRVRRGMPARIALAAVKQEEYGFLVGRVDAVSPTPATREAMMRVLHNEMLVQELSGGGAPNAVSAMLLRDFETPSGYRWSSSRGPVIEIGAGAKCQVEVVVEERAPIKLVLPFLRKKLGL